jgi:hypothetical protein
MEENVKGRNGVREKRGKEERGKEKWERMKGGNAATFHFAYITSRVGPRVLYFACPAILLPLFNEITK